ncbi:MAG: hypothetical protein PHI03_08675, partial [Bacteroidales bacterium]|nr:hypothetical protein [Bacteroidales bacterium]
NLEMLNLTPNTAYTVRAFATNSDNLTGYGQPKQFTTLRKYEVTLNVFEGDGPAPTPLDATVTILNKDTQETIISETPSSTHTFNLTNNAYVLKVEAEGYHTHTEEYTPTGNEIKEVILYTTQADETLVTFTATDNDGPVSNVKIKIGTVVNYTNNLGVATFYLASGVHTYWPTVPEGYEEVYATTVSVPQESNVDITLRKQVKVTFNVKNPNGTPTTQAYGYITYVGEYEWDPFESTFDVSNGTGHVFLPPDSLGTWNYSITSDIYTANGNIVLIENSDDIVEPVQLQGPPATYTVKVHITGTDNEDIMDAMVMLTDNTYFEEVQYSDVDGMVTFENVIVHGDQPDMQYHLTITKDGFEEIDEPFYLDVWSIMQLDPNGTGTITIERELTPL